MFAQKSLAFNLRNSNFVELFPDIVSEIKQRLGTQAAAAAAGPGGASKSGSSSAGSSSSARANGSANALASDSHKDSNKNANSGQAEVAAACGADGGVGVLGVAGAVASGDLGGSGAAALKNCARNSYLNWQSIYSNLVIIICFAIFALIVNYVIKNLNQE